MKSGIECVVDNSHYERLYGIYKKMATESQSTAHTSRPNLGGIGQLANLYLTS